MTRLETEPAAVIETDPSHHLHPWQQWFYLCLLAAALGYAVFEHGARNLLPWNISLLIIGMASFGYWVTTRSSRLAPVMERLLGYLALLVPAYIAFQLIPLPMFLLRILSPERAQIADNLRPVMAPDAFASLTISPETTFAYLFRIIGYLLVFLLVREVAARSRRPLVVTIPLIVIAALEAAAGLLQAAGGTEVNGTYWNRNHFAGLLEMVLPITIACAIVLLKGARGSSIIGRLGSAAVVLFLAGLMLVALISSGSKMGFVACMGGLFVMSAVACVATVTGKKRWWIVGVLAAFFVAMFVALPPDELVNSFGNAASDQTGEGRLPIWSDSRHLFTAYLVTGSGLGTFDTAFLKYQTAVLNNEFDFAHNDYLQLATEMGALGILILGGFVLATTVKALRSGTRRFDLNTRYLAWGSTGSMAAIGIHSFTDFNTYIPANALVLAWIFGIVASFPRRSRHAVRTPSRTVPWRPLAIVLAGLLLCYAPAWVLLEAKFTGYPRMEAQFCRFGVCDTAAMIASETDKHGGSVASVPQDELLAALRRDPDAAFRWCDLGAALLKSGQAEQAKECFSIALAHAPNIPPMQLRAANFYFDIHDEERALELASRVLENSALYDGAIFNTYRREQIPLSTILLTGLPRNHRAWQSYLHYLLDLGKFTDAASVWDGIVALRYGDDRLAHDYLASLLQDHRYQAAAQAWAHYLGDRGQGYLQSNYIYNGDFEAELSAVQFDWTTEDLNDDVKVTIDPSVAHTGSRSLKIQFGGKANVNYDRISQRAFVKPGRYRFSAFIRAEGVTTDQGIGFRISDAESSGHLDVKTEQVTGSTDWRKIEKIVSVPPGTRLLTIQVVRPASWRFDSFIAGTAWIDTVSLSRVE